MVFEGSLDELSSLKLPHDTAFSVVIDASWYKSEESTSYGDAHYEFNVIIRNKAEFFVSATEIKAGGFITLTVKNAQTLSKLFYTADGDALVSTPEEYSDNETAAIQSIYSFSPNFVLNASTAQAIIAFPADLPSLTFEFQLSYGASEQDFSIKVEKQSYTDYAFSKAKKELKAILSDEGMSKIKNTLNKIPNSPQDTVFFDYAFSAPQNFTSGYTYFNYVIPNDSDEGFISFGNEYLATTKGGQAVNALNSGIVTKVGKTSQLGNYVVIDHGLGLKTVYCGLSDVNVSVGSAISQNVSIGKCGTSPMVSEDGFLLMCVANDTVINPLHIIGKNIK